jgi:hypothetical protein
MFRFAYAGVLTLFGMLCILAGIYEIAAKRRLFGREIFPRNAPHRSDDWTPDGWRKNGIKLASVGALLVGIGVAAFII